MVDVLHVVGRVHRARAARDALVAARVLQRAEQEPCGGGGRHAARAREEAAERHGAAKVEVLARAREHVRADGHDLVERAVVGQPTRRQVSKDALADGHCSSPQRCDRFFFPRVVDSHDDVSGTQAMTSARPWGQAALAVASLLFRVAPLPSRPCDPHTEPVGLGRARLVGARRGPREPPSRAVLLDDPTAQRVYVIAVVARAASNCTRGRAYAHLRRQRGDACHDDAISHALLVAGALSQVYSLVAARVEYPPTAVMADSARRTAAVGTARRAPCRPPVE